MSVDGQYTVTLKGTTTITDQAGNPLNNGSDEVLAFVLDTTSPSVPVVTGVGDDTGTPGDGITNDNSLVICGEAAASSTVEVFVGSNLAGVTAANSSGIWSLDYTGTSLADGTYELTATAADAAGNTSAASTAFTVGSLVDPGWLDTHTAVWDFGDGVSQAVALTEEHERPDATGTCAVNHVYAVPGTYTVTLTVVDDDGGVGTATLIVRVVGAAQVVDLMDAYIQSLPSQAFKGPASERKKALHGILVDVKRMIERGKYQGATDKLVTDIRAKADGSVGGDAKNDWIIDPLAQYDLCNMVDDIRVYLSRL